MNKSNTNRRGFSTVRIVVVCLVVVAAVTSGIFISKQNKIKLSTNNASPSSTRVPITGANLSQTEIDEAWKTYTSTKYGFSFSYPQEWKIEERDPSKAFDSESTELSLWLVNPSAPDHAETVAITVLAKDISRTTPIGGDSPEYKQELNLKGKNTTKYTFPQSASVNRIMYHFAVNSKTYTIETVNEERNIERNPDYIAKFDKIVDSVQLP